MDQEILRQFACVCSVAGVMVRQNSSRLRKSFSTPNHAEFVASYLFAKLLVLPFCEACIGTVQTEP
jgi:hypothetical protein